MALTATTGGGTQTATQSPQTSAGASGFGTTQQSGSVQPGTTQSLLTSTGGVPLTSTPLSTVNLSASTQTAATQAATTKHHASPALVVGPIVLLLVAALLVWQINKSAKRTTDY